MPPNAFPTFPDRFGPLDPDDIVAPVLNFRSRVLSELRFQISRDIFDLPLAAARLHSTRADVLDALGWLRGAGLVRFDVDAGYVLQPIAFEVA